MNKYTIFCTEEQTKKAFKLGCPIDTWGFARELVIPTAEQMVGWLDEKGQEIEIGRIPKDGDFAVFINGFQEVGCYYPTRKDAMLGAIDFALILLENGD